MTINAQLLQNPDCDVSKVLSGSGWSSTTRFALGGNRYFATYFTPFSDGPGDYLLSVTYVSDLPLRVRIGDSGWHAMPATIGNTIAFRVPVAATPASDNIVFDDQSEEASGDGLVRVDLRKVA